ncbi:MAG: PTS sugar transporter subunit IIA [Candidatus Riflebacteria bacterium]|nr:PTS sugar transporter subunit IIA [Candidatus Riflebacteria bacterium]
MKALLTALQEGHLLELPEGTKEESLQFLSRLIEADPDLDAGSLVEEAVLTREKTKNSGLGYGWACPVARTPKEGEVICAAGWSPQGIEYNSPDKKPVHLIVLYYVPDSRKNEYLKEIAALNRVIEKTPALQNLATIKDIAEARHKILDLINVSLESSIPDAKARMIRLETKAALVASQEVQKQPVSLDLSRIVPASILVMPGGRPTILAQDTELITHLEGLPNLAEMLARDNRVEQGSYVLLVRSSTTYQLERVLYDCLVLKPAGSPHQSIPSSRN